MRLFHNRREAAHELARHLSFLKNEDPIVLGLVSGGVPIAEIIAQALEASLDLLIIARLCAPKQPDHVVGAVDEHGRISMIKSTARWHQLTSQQMVAPAREVFRQVQRRRSRMRAILPEMDVRDRTVVIVGQGVATGAKMLGAIASVRDRGARKVVAAAPAGSGEAAWQLHDAADLVVIPHRPAKFTSVADFYTEFSPVTDEMVKAIIERWVKTRPQQQPGVKTLAMKLYNDLGQMLICEADLPPGTTRGSGPYPAVVFAHGFESDGRSARTIPIAQRLAKRGIIAVRPDFTGHGHSEGELDDATEERLYNDLKIVVNAIRPLNEVDEDRLGLIGSGTGAMLALRLAVDPRIKAVVVRGPMCGKEIDAAAKVKAPSLLIYAEQETEFAKKHREQGGRLPSTHQILEIPDATRLFNDAISLEMMVGATVDWFVDHIGTIPVGEGPEEGEAPAAEPPPDASARVESGQRK
jgi:putative phosphoribosyl transferase